MSTTRRLSKLLTTPRSYWIGLLAVLLLLWVATVDVLVALLWRQVRGKRQRGGESTPPKPDSFVLLPLSRWEGAFQRPQHLAVGLSKRGYQTFYIDPAPLHWVARNLWWYVARLHLTVRPRLVVSKPWVLPGEHQVAIIRKLNQWHLIQWERLLLLLHGKSAPVVYTHVPAVAEVAGGLSELVLWYDIIDDFTATSWIGSESRRLEERLIACADVVTTGTYELLMRKCRREDGQLLPKSSFIQCGVDYEHFAGRSIKAVPAPIPEALRGLPRPVIGFFGVLNERINGDVLLAIARAHPDWTVALIGPMHDDFDLADFPNSWSTVVDDPTSPDFRLKPDTPTNLHFTGLVPYLQLPGMLDAFDVCILPYRRSPITEVIHPVKLIEYLCSGKPVVSTRLPDVERFYTGLVEMADTPEEFLAAVEHVFRHPDAERKRRGIELAKSRTWQRMADEMLDTVLQRLGHEPSLPLEPVPTTEQD